MLELLQTAPVDQLPQATNAAPWGESIADEVMWIGLFSTVYGLGRRWLMGELLPDDLSAVDLDAVEARRNGTDRLRAWALYALFAVTTTAGVYLLTALAWALLWVGAVAFVGAVVALWGYRGGTPIDDFRTLLIARSQAGEE